MRGAIQRRPITLMRYSSWLRKFKPWLIADTEHTMHVQVGKLINVTHMTNMLSHITPKLASTYNLVIRLFVIHTMLQLEISLVRRHLWTNKYLTFIAVCATLPFQVIKLGLLMHKDVNINSISKVRKSAIYAVR